MQNGVDNSQSLLAIKKLLQEISFINLKYDKLREANDTQFNIFTILRKGAEEVGLHSRFIGELLNPKGVHNRGCLFQKLFIKLVLGNEIQNNNLFSVEIECTNGDFGRIDLLLIGNEEVIVIENKIYASDQKKQLERYNNAIKMYYPSKKRHLIYLTLYGQPPSAFSLGEIKKEKVKCISYQNEIISWLEACSKEVYDSPTLRETIIQYRRLVEKLTGQTLNREQKMEIKKIILQDDNFKHALAIEAVLNEAKIDVQKKVWNELEETLANKGYIFTFVNSNLEPIDKTICDSFYRQRNSSSCYGLQYQIATLDGYSIHFYIEVNRYLYYGFTLVKNTKRSKLVDKFEKEKQEYLALRKRLEKLVRVNSRSEWWLAYKYSDEKIDFKNFNEDTAKLANNEYRQNWIKQVSIDIINLLQDYPKSTKL